MDKEPSSAVQMLEAPQAASAPGRRWGPVLGHTSEDTEQPGKPVLSDLASPLPVIYLN